MTSVVKSPECPWRTGGVSPGVPSVASWTSAAAAAEPGVGTGLRCGGLSVAIDRASRRNHHRLERRVQARPEAKRGGSLVDKHVEPVDDAGATLPREAHQRRLDRPVGEVHDDVVMRYGIGIDPKRLAPRSRRFALLGPAHRP